MMAHRQPSRRRAFTLIESVVSLVIVSVMLLAAIGTLGAAARVRHIADAQGRRNTLARDLMNEIAGQPFDPPADDPSLPHHPTRSMFTDITDYDEWSHTPPVDPAGVEIPGYAGWTREVTVRWADPAALEQDALVDTGLRRVEVTVIDPEGRTKTIRALRSRRGVSGMRFTSGGVYLSRIDVEMQTAAGGSEVLTTSVPLLNTPDEVDVTGGNLLTNPGFESEPLTPWYGYRATIKPKSDEHSGQESAEVSDRSTWLGYNGALQYPLVGRVAQDRSYLFEAWILPRSQDETVRVSLFATEGETVWESRIQATAREDIWTRVSGVLTTNWTVAPEDVVLSITTDSLEVFLVDDVSLTPLGAP